VSAGLSTHVLDTAEGRPASGVEVTLERRGGAEGSWRLVAAAVTGADGRVAALLPGGAALEATSYRLTFAVGAYLASSGRAAFFPEVAVVVAIADPDAHHHIPLLLSPFGYTTYRGG